MKAVRIEKPGEVRLVELPIPEVPAGFARIKLVANAICATDLELIDGRIAARYPLIPGHNLEIILYEILVQLYNVTRHSYCLLSAIRVMVT